MLLSLSKEHTAHFTACLPGSKQGHAALYQSFVTAYSHEDSTNVYELAVWFVVTSIHMNLPIVSPGAYA